MNRIENFIPNTFFSSDKVLKIFDEKKNVFYFHPNKRGSITFNLPKGIYFSKNKIFKKDIFQPYKIFVSPFPKGFLNDVTIIEKDNPNKASIFRNKKHIIVDGKIVNHEFKGVPIFTIAHEIGHFIHFPKRTINVNSLSHKLECEKVERDADEFAVNYMLGTGWNPTQIKLAKDLVLSHDFRKLCLDKLTTQSQNNYLR